MIIDKLKGLLTEEESDKREEIVKALLNEMAKGKIKAEKAQDLFLALGKINATAKARYEEKIKKTPDLLLEDVKEILNALTKEDHYSYIDQQKAIIKDLAITNEDLKKSKQAGATPSEYLLTTATDTPEGAKAFLNDTLSTQGVLYKRFYKPLQTGDTRLEDLIQEKIEEWYPEIPAHFSTFQNTATNTYTTLSKRVLKEDRIANKGTYKANNVIITIDDIKNTALTPQASKVLQIILKDLTANISQYSTEEGLASPDKRRVTLTLKDYMKLCGLKDPKNARQQLNNAINTLYHSSLTFKQNIYKGKGRKPEEHAFDMRIISLRDRDGIIKNGKIDLIANTDFALALCHSSIMDYPTCLLNVREKRNPSSYAMGLKIATHHRMNKRKKNSNRIAVKTLLSVCTELPTYKEEREKSSQVTDHIIEPFERDLMALKEDYHLLKKWNYCNHKGAPLTDEQIENYSYTEWINWLIDFELEEN